MGSLGATAAFVSAAPLDAETARCSAAACVVQVGAVFFRELRTRNSHAFSPPPLALPSFYLVPSMFARLGCDRKKLASDSANTASQRYGSNVKLLRKILRRVKSEHGPFPHVTLR